MLRHRLPARLVLRAERRELHRCGSLRPCRPHSRGAVDAFCGACWRARRPLQRAGRRRQQWPASGYGAALTIEVHRAQSVV
eukprot:7143992-Prymnesium_polylepis.1